MADEKHESKRSCYSRHKWLPAAAAILLLVFLAAGFSFRYISFMSQTIYQESTSHLEEVLYKSNSMLKEMVRKNLTYLHLCNGFLKNTSNEDEIQAYIEEAQQATGFVNFYFLSYDGNYTTVTGETGYLGLQTNLDEKLSDGEDIVVNTALPGKAPMLAFICPETQGSYRGFAYDAVAITYYNDAVLRLLDSSAFQGNASNYVIYPDGRVVIDNSVNRKEIIYNFIAMLRDHSDLSEEQILALSDDFAQGRSGNLRVKLGDTSYYLVYEDTAVQNWTMVGLVPVSIVNASLDKLWFHTVQIVAGIAFGLAVLIILLILRRSHTTLRRKDTEILYRDELFQKLSLNVDDVFLMLDAKTSKVDYVSPNVERLLGIPWKEVRQDARALAALHPKDDPDRDKNFLEGLLSGQQREWDFEFEHRETKERRWFHNIAMGSEVEGRTKYILVLSDRTADRQVNQALSDAVAAAETANRAKSTFLSNMSHDIRTPMNAIIGYADLAEKHRQEPERLQGYLKNIQVSGEKMLSIIDNVLELSRIESGKVTLEETAVEAGSIFESCVVMVQPELERKHQTMTVEKHTPNPYLYMDTSRILEVILNLVSNAIKYTGDGGHIRCTIRQLPSDREGWCVQELSVADNGIGMSEEFQQHIFEAFARERSSTVSGVAGSGLGMGIVKKLVDLMNGSIDIQSKLGEGSTFTVYIPCRLARQEDAVPKRAAERLDKTGLAGRRILLAEDNDLNAEITAELMGEEGLLVDRAENGAHCLEMLEKAPAGMYDAILMDVQMPVLDGYEATQKIRRLTDPWRANIPIIAITANAFAEDRQRALEVGMDDHVAKPIDMAKLIPVLQKQLHKHDGEAEEKRFSQSGP